MLRNVWWHFYTSVWQRASQYQKGTVRQKYNMLDNINWQFPQSSDLQKTQSNVFVGLSKISRTRSNSEILLAILGHEVIRTK